MKAKDEKGDEWKTSTMREKIPFFGGERERMKEREREKTGFLKGSCVCSSKITTTGHKLQNNSHS
jgi:hypothetical protein